MGLVLLRYGELALKGKNRSEFVRRLRRNIRACLKAHNLDGQVTSVGQRIYVQTDQPDQALEPLSRVFGLTSLSPVVQVPREIDAIIKECVRQAKEAGVKPGTSFRVRSRRVDKTFPYISPEIDRLAGEAILQELGGKVDLSSEADVTIGVEVTREGALVFSRVIPALGGLPIGTEGRVVALISGGIDSPVAAWMMMKRGCNVIPLHFSSNEVETSKALDNIQVLSRYSYGWELRPIILNHHEIISPVIEELRVIGQARWACIFCKRTLLQKASEIAEEFGAHALVMGDALGQVASQTLANMEVISYGIPKPILRPLIGLDKTEIIAIAQKIGTFDISIRDEAGCPFLPPNPITRASVAQLKEILKQLGYVEPLS